MKRIIVDYKKLTQEILNLLVEKFPEGYGIRDIVKFTNQKGHFVEAVEVSTNDTMYLVKISDELVDSMENYDEDDNDDEMIPIEIDSDLVIDHVELDDVELDDVELDDVELDDELIDDIEI